MPMSRLVLHVTHNTMCSGLVDMVLRVLTATSPRLGGQMETIAWTHTLTVQALLKFLFFTHAHVHTRARVRAPRTSQVAMYSKGEGGG